MAKVVLVTVHNPGAMGARYVAASARAAGHDVWLLHFKSLRYETIPSDDLETRRRVEASNELCVHFRRPGYIAYAPFPDPATDAERQLFQSELRRLRPDVIGFSTFSARVDLVRELIALAREAAPGVPIAWGGVHAILVMPHAGT